MSARRRQTFVPAPKDYTAQTMPVAPFLGAVVAVVFLLAVIAALTVVAVVISR